MSKSYKIDGELIKSSGEKLKRIGYLMISQVVLLCLYFLVVSNSRDIDTIQSMSVLSIITSIGIWIFIVRYFIQSGDGFIQSVQIIYEDGKNEDHTNQGEHKEFYPNGNLKKVGVYKDGKNDGLWEYYHENGHLSDKGTYKDGKENGLWEVFNDNGQLKRTGTYKDGKENGIWKLFNDNGQLRTKGTYKDGERDGRWEFFNEDGTLDTEQSGLYEDGVKVSD